MDRWPRVLVAASAFVIFSAVAIAAATAVPEFDRAARLAMGRDYDGALHEYEAFLARAPQDRLSPVAATAIANILLQRGDSTAALSWLDRILSEYRASPWGPEAARQKGACAEARKQWVAAGEAYRLAVELSAAPGVKSRESWINEVTLAAANCFYQAGDRAGVIDTYQRVLEMSPPAEVAASALYRLGESYESSGDSKKAAENYAKVVERYPSSDLLAQAVAKRAVIEPHVKLDWRPYQTFVAGTSLVNRRDYEGALRNCDSVLAATENPALLECAEYRKIALETALAGDYTEGCRKLRGFIDEHAGGQRTELARRTLEQNWSPIADLESRVRGGQADLETLQNLGGMYLNVRSGRRAVETLEKALALGPEDAQTHLLLGYGYSLTGRNEEALKAFSFYVERNPNDADALNIIGYNYLGQGQPDKAIPYFQRYAELAPDDANAHDSLGEGLFAAGRLEESAKEYEKAVQINPSFSNSSFMLGRVYQQMGEKAKAIRAYERFVELSPSGPQADQARSALAGLRAP